MPFSIHPFRRFPVQCSVTCNAGPFVKLPLAYFAGFWLLTTILALSPEPVHAEWVLVSRDEAEMNAYVDTDSIRRKGNLVKMWQLHNCKTVQTVADNSFLSSKSQFEYDCAEERGRILAQSFFSGQMGNGHVIHSDSDESKWSPVEPESIGNSLWSFACSKK